MAGNIHFAVRPEALFLSKNAEEIKEVRCLFFKCEFLLKA